MMNNSDEAPDTALLAAAASLVAFAVIALVAGSCGPVAPTESRGPVIYVLPTTPPDWARDLSCGGGEVTPLVLNGELTDGTALVTANGTIPIYWPRGFAAVFSPSLVVLRPDGTPFAKQGEAMTGDLWHGTIVCPTGIPGAPPGKLMIWIGILP